MKKLCLIVLVSIFLISIFAMGAAGKFDLSIFGQTGGAQKQKTPTEGVMGALTDFIGMIEGILGGLLGSITKKPEIWLRVLLFVAIFAVLARIAERKEINMDKKTASILAFVIAFATAAITPTYFLQAIVSMYSGAILIGVLVVPTVIGALLTIKHWHGSRWTKILIGILWILYAAIASSTFTTLAAMAPPGAFKGTLAEYMFAIVVGGGMVLGVILLVWGALKGKKKEKGKKGDEEEAEGGWLSWLFNRIRHPLGEEGADTPNAIIGIMNGCIEKANDMFARIIDWANGLEAEFNKSGALPTLSAEEKQDKINELKNAEFQIGLIVTNSEKLEKHYKKLYDEKKINKDEFKKIEEANTYIYSLGSLTIPDLEKAENLARNGNFSELTKNSAMPQKIMPELKGLDNLVSNLTRSVTVTERRIKSKKP